MKKVLISLVALMSLVACGTGSTSTPSASPTAVTITNSVNVQTTAADMSGYRWLEDSSPAFVEMTLAESVRMFAEGGSGILYYGYAGCPWCDRAVPVLNDVAKEMGVTIYYINVHAQTTMEAYNELMTYLEPILEKDNNGEPVFKVPEVISVKNGEIQGHNLALVDDFKIESDESQMNEAQVTELSNIYRDLIEKAAD